ncbi:MAG: PAS domain S-box protein [Deltaproteobacteria bacterium]|nr:PAS domain S-box protein [Deltaproteobacteria bacterium]
MSQFLTILLPLTLVFLLAFFLEYRAEVGAERARLVTQEASAIQDGVRRVERGLEIATGDLNFVVDLVAEVLEDGAPEPLAALERSTLTFLRHRPSYFQIRFIGATGQEILRAESTADGPRITPESELQDKSGRGYFTDAMRLGAGELFISPMELNVENGVVEEPYRPVVRLATPIDDAAGRRRGIVILNAHGEHFIRAFEPNADEAGIKRMVVNSDGYWLQLRPEVESGVVLEQGRSFQGTFADVWPLLLANPQGWIESREGLFYSLPNWMFISLVPHRLFNEIGVGVATSLLLIATPLYFILVLIGCLLAAANHRRRLADEAVRSLEGVKRAMMIAALDGIVVMDEAGITLEFNPSAQRIFGYTLEEARGRLVADLIIPSAYRETHRLGLEHYLETGEGRIIDKHIDELTGIRKGGEEFPVELTVCPVMVMGKQFFYGFLRDLSEPGRIEVESDEGSALPPDPLSAG